MLNKITSLTNPKIKEIVSLRSKNKRDQKSLTIIEGSREIQRALESNIQVKEIYYTADSLLEGIDIDSFEVTAEVFKKISYGHKESGILGLANIKPKELKDISLIKKANLVVVIEKVEKPGNLGAILRTCDGAGVDLVIMCDQEIDFFNPNVIRSSLGSVFLIDLVKATKEEALEFLKTNAINIFATTPGTTKLYTQADFTKNSAIVMGSEKDGLSDFWINNADQPIRIPMLGKIDSLNVSTSTAVILYETIRQRNN